MTNALRLSAVLLWCTVSDCSCTPPVVCASGNDCPTGYFCALPDGVCTRSLDAVDAAIHDASSELGRDRAAPDTSASDRSAPDVVEHERHEIDASAVDGARSDAAVADQADPDRWQLDVIGTDRCVPDCSASCGNTGDGCGGPCPNPCDRCTSTTCVVVDSDYLCICRSGYLWSPAAHACVYQNDGQLTLTAGENRDLSAPNLSRVDSCADGAFFAVTSIGSNEAGIDRDPGCCLGAGDRVLLINLQGAPSLTPNVGKYETATISHVTGNQVVLTSSVAKKYGASANLNDDIGLGQNQQRVALIRVPIYSAVTVLDGATLTTAAWNGANGGVLALFSTGAITIRGAIDMAGAGYSTPCSNGATGGIAYNAGSLPNKMYLGSGGGGSSFDTNASCSAGGAGGGSILLEAKGSLVVNPSTGWIRAEGRSADGSDNMVGGGGAGGSILLRAQVVSLATDRVNALGGASAWGGSNSGPQGGSGGVWVASPSITGESVPPHSQ